MSLRTFTWASLLGAAALAVVFSPLASKSPDGLEKVAADQGFTEKATSGTAPSWSPLPEYVFPGIENRPLATAIAGGCGMIIAFGAALVLGYLVRARRDPREEAERHP